MITCLGGGLLTGCFQSEVSSPSPSPSVSVVAVTLPPVTPVYPWTDENATMSGFCFEAASDTAGQVFILRSAEDHIHFYELADNSHLCRHPVARYPFDFSGGRVLVGLWSRGTGCTARHEVVNIERDDTARTLTLTLRFVTEGDCPYELVRPFWIGLDRANDYEITVKAATMDSSP